MNDAAPPMDLRKAIESAINLSCAENASDTPDFILAEYLTDALASFDKATRRRDKWYNFKTLTGHAGAPRPTISELEAILNSEEPVDVHVAPDGSIHTSPE